MLPKVLCFFAIVAAVAAAPYSDSQYTDQLQKDYNEDDRYVDTTEDYGKVDDTQQQFQEKDEQNAEFKDIEQLEPEIDEEDEQDENIEQTDKDMEGIEQFQQDTEDDLQKTEQIDQETEYQPSKIEQFEQQDNDWNQNEDNDDNPGDDTIHFEEDMDGLETDSAIGKLFGDSTVQEQEEKDDDDQYQQKSEVGQEFNNNDDQLPVEDIVPSPSYNSNYESGYHGVYNPPDPFEPEVYTVKPPWYKRFWGKTKETAKGVVHKVKQAFGKK